MRCSSEPGSSKVPRGTAVRIAVSIEDIGALLGRDIEPSLTEISVARSLSERPEVMTALPGVRDVVAVELAAQWVADLERAGSALRPRKLGVVGLSLGGAFALT